MVLLLCCYYFSWACTLSARREERKEQLIRAILLVRRTTLVLLVIKQNFVLRQCGWSFSFLNVMYFHPNPVHWDPKAASGRGMPQLQGAKWFSFEEIKKCTNNFSAENNVGSGGYGKVSFHYFVSVVILIIF